MTQNPLFSVSVSSKLPADERESLLLALRTTVDIQESAKRISGEEWLTFIAVIKGIGSVASTAAALIKLASEIKSWRTNARLRGAKPDVKLQNPSKPPLDLSTATDEEVDEWFSK